MALGIDHRFLKNEMLARQEGVEEPILPYVPLTLKRGKKGISFLFPYPSHSIPTFVLPGTVASYDGELSCRVTIRKNPKPQNEGDSDVRIEPLY